MFVVTLLECIYFDTANPYRSSEFDTNRMVEQVAARDAEDAKSIIEELLRQYGDIGTLEPKIIHNEKNKIWIECDSPFERLEKQGQRIDKCVAILVETRLNLDDANHSMKDFAKVLGPDYLI